MNNDIVHILLYGFWVPLSLFASLYLFWTIFKRRIVRSRYSSPDEREEYFKLRYQLNNELRSVQSELERINVMVPKVFESLLEELPRRLSGRIEHRLDERLDMTHAKLVDAIHMLRADPQAREMQMVLQQQIQVLSNKLEGVRENLHQGEADSETNRQDESVQVIREISHSLNTPLSQIEASVLALQATKSIGHEIPTDYVLHLDAMQKSVDLCKSVIGAYRGLVLFAQSSNAWTPRSLPAAVESALELCQRKLNKTLLRNVQLPEQVEGYYNNFMIALLLPLVENAVEASPKGGEVRIHGHRSNGNLLIEVSNHCGSAFPDHDIYSDGFSTKDGHEGTGLTIVKHLLGSLRDATITHEVQGARVTFRISLPVGEQHV